MAKRTWIGPLLLMLFLVYSYYEMRHDPEIKQRGYLSKAIEKGDIDTVKTLYNDNPEILKIEFGFPPLFEACRYCKIEIARFLIEKGANIHDKKTRHKPTPLHVAAYTGCNEIIELLLKNGADINARNILGETPLMYAIENGNVQTAKLLIDKGANIKATSRSYGTALDFAIRYKRYEIINILQKKIIDEKNSY